MNTMRGTVVLSFLLVAILLLPISTQAQMILNENFEQDSDTWPWTTGMTSGWQCAPWPATHPNNYTWGVEDSCVYHRVHDGWYRSMFCNGLPDNLSPGIDDYMPGQESWAVWGPFDATLEMVTVIGNFYAWSDVEPWDDGEGDNFYMLAAVDPQDLVMENWDIAFDMGNDESFLQSHWTSVGFNLNQMWDWDGNPVSLIPEGQAVEDIYIAFVFISDDDDNTGLGVFVDDIYVSGYDGSYDFEIDEPDFMVYEDGELETCSGFTTEDEVYVANNFTSFGLPLEYATSHVLYLNEDVMNPESEYVPIDTMTAIWPANPLLGTIIDSLFQLPLTFSDTGWVGVKIVLDAPDDVVEIDEENNTYIDTFYVTFPQTRPEMIWHDLNGSDETDTEVTVDLSERTTLIIDYTAMNYPIQDNATISFGIGEELDSTGSFIGSLTNLTIDNEQHQVEWDVSDMPQNREFYLFAYLTDNATAPVYSYASQQVIIITPVKDVSSDAGIPEKFAIASAYPNPFNPTVEVQFAMPQAGQIEMRWYSLEGRLVDHQVRTVSAGYPVLGWTPHSLASGVYLLQAETPSGIANTRVFYLK